MSTVQFDATFILAAANLEMTKANIAVTELNRLATIGYLDSQTGLDKAEEVKAHLTRAYALLDKVDTPDANATKTGLAATIAAQDLIIHRIKGSMKLKEQLKELGLI